MDTRGIREVMKVFNNHPHPGASCGFSTAEFNSTGRSLRAADTVNAITGRGAFMVGCNFSPGLEEDIYRMTVNAAGQNIQFRYKFIAPILTNSLDCSFFLMYEGDVIIDAGIMTVEY